MINMRSRPRGLGRVIFRDALSGQTHAAAIQPDGIALKSQSSGSEYPSVKEWMESRREDEEKAEPFKHAQCEKGCDFTAGWGLGGNAPGCDGPRPYCFSCCKNIYTPAEGALARLRNDLHLCGPFGEAACKRCFDQYQLTPPVGQHYGDPGDRSDAWAPATCCLEHLLGYNVAHNKGPPPNVNGMGTYLIAAAVLPSDHPALKEAEELIAVLRKMQAKHESEKL